MSPVISQRLMYDHLGEEVNVILHDGSSYWRRLVAVGKDKIELAGTELMPLMSIRYEDIRSFGTEAEGILEEVEAG